MSANDALLRAGYYMRLDAEKCTSSWLRYLSQGLCSAMLGRYGGRGLEFLLLLVFGRVLCFKLGSLKA